MKILILIVGDTDATSEASELPGRDEANFGIRSCPGGIIINIRPAESLRLILGLFYEINLAEIKLKD